MDNQLKVGYIKNIDKYKKKITSINKMIEVYERRLERTQDELETNDTNFLREMEKTQIDHLSHYNRQKFELEVEMQSYERRLREWEESNEK